MHLHATLLLIAMALPSLVLASDQSPPSSGMANGKSSGAIRRSRSPRPFKAKFNARPISSNAPPLSARGELDRMVDSASVPFSIIDILFAILDNRSFTIGNFETTSALAMLRRFKCLFALDDTTPKAHKKIRRNCAKHDIIPPGGKRRVNPDKVSNHLPFTRKQVWSSIHSQFNREKTERLPISSSATVDLADSCSNDANLYDIISRAPMTLILSTMMRYAFFLSQEQIDRPIDFGRLDRYMIHLKCLRITLKSLHIPTSATLTGDAYSLTKYGAVSSVIDSIFDYDPFKDLIEHGSRPKLACLTFFDQVRINILPKREEADYLTAFIYSWNTSYATLMIGLRSLARTNLDSWKAELIKQLSSAFA